MSWHGHSAAHAAAGRKGGMAQNWKTNPGNFRNDPAKAARAGRIGGKKRKGVRKASAPSIVQPSTKKRGAYGHGDPRFVRETS